jgi:hypothetical protein
MERLGLRFASFLFLAADHLTLATNDEYGPGADFLGDHRVVRNPAHVTYVVDPETDSPRAGAVADHAYWLSGLRARDGLPRATIDVRSEGFGRADPDVEGVVGGTGTLEGGSRGPTPYTSKTRKWGIPPVRPRADKLIVRASGLASAVVDARRARVGCAPAIDLQSDGPLDLRIACTPLEPRRTPASAGCAAGKRLRVKLPAVRGRRVTRAAVLRRGKVLRRVRGRDLRRVAVRRPTRKAFTLRIRLRTSGKRPATITVVRKIRAC